MHILENFKGFKKAEINLFNPLTVLIGRNGAGKSNLIEAIELLSAVASGAALHSIGDSSEVGGVVSLRGGLQSCPTIGQKQFTLGFKAGILFDGKQRQMTYRVTISVDPEPQISAESLILDSGDLLIFETTGASDRPRSGSIQVRYNNFAQGGKKPKTFVSSARSVLSQYPEFSEKNLKKKWATVRFVQHVLEYLKSAFIFDPNPKKMRDYCRIGDNILRRDGSNLSSVLYYLSEHEPETLSLITRSLHSIPDADFSTVEFATTPFKDVIFGLNESENLVSARLLSDGTLRALAVLTALATSKPTARVVVEEFDNGLHPSRVATLVDAILAFTTRSKHARVLVTTHNPATLNYLSSDTLNMVAVAARVGTDAVPSVISLHDIPRYEELLERGRLGDLITSNILPTYLDPGFEEKRQDALKNWFRSLEG